jgi:hypothetical protein
MNAKHLMPLVITAVVTLLQTATYAQGTSTGPFTVDVVQPGPVVFIGTAANPVPIDLDPVGPPWLKSVMDPQNIVQGPAILDLVETILNVGTEPWTDWHEVLLPPPVGVVPSTWANVVGLSINNNPIGFSAFGIGLQTLDLYGFSQPVLPGDVFQIHKQVQVFGSLTGVGGELLRILEYPTTVPEPSALVLVAAAALTFTCRRPCTAAA